MKTYEFRYLNRDGQTIYETLELPDDAALMIGRDKHNREVYEGDGVFAPDNFLRELPRLELNHALKLFRGRKTQMTAAHG